MPHKEVFQPSRTKPPFQYDKVPESQVELQMLRMSLGIPTWLALGAVLQSCLILLPISKYLTLAPAVLYLLSRILPTAVLSLGILPNPYLKGSIPYRYTALVPDKYGNFAAEGESPTNQKVAVLILCAKLNHPMGWVGAPHAQTFGQYFDNMSKELRALPQSESGFLGHSQATMPAADGTVEVLSISYWRSKDHIHKYSESPTHRAAVKWWSDMDAYDGNGGKIPHIGIGHEIYEALPGNWESVYLGYQPTLLGATTYERRGADVEKGDAPTEWISPIIDARRGKLAGSRGRMGMDQRGQFGDIEM